MNPSVFSFLICAIFCLVGTITRSQSVENVRASYREGKVVVFYDLVHANPELPYTVELRGSHNNYSSALRTVSGDVGIDVKAGAGKKVEWNILADLGAFNGEMTFKVKAKSALAFRPVASHVAHRGRDTAVEWQGGDDRPVKIEFYKGSERIETFNEKQNSGRYVWRVPVDTRTGGDYSWKISVGAEEVVSDPFMIKPKIPHLLKALPVLAIGGVVVALGGGGPADGEAGMLPAAPGPK